MARFSVSSGVWTPSSIRVEYATSRFTAALSAPRKDTVGWPPSSGGSAASQASNAGPRAWAGLSR